MKTSTRLKNIKNRIATLCLIALFCLGNRSGAQAQSFGEGTIAVNAGIGLFSSIGYYAGSGIHRTPVISLTGEYGITRLGPGVLGGGLAFGYQSASYTYNTSSPYYYKDKWATTLFGLRGTYHPDFLQDENYDVYGVVQLSFDHFGYSFSTNDPYYNSATYVYGRSAVNSYVRAYLLVGGRYYFTKNIGVYGELGYDIAYVKFGLTLKFGESPDTDKK